MLKNNKSLFIGIGIFVLIAGAVLLLKNNAATPPVSGGSETAAQLSSESAAVESTPTAAESSSVTSDSASEVAAPTATEAPAAAVAEAAPATEPALEGPIVSPEGFVDVKKAMADRSIGSETAPVTIIEYASLTCPHCAHFATTNLAAVKEKLVNTGKLRLVFRDFPLDQYAMKAAKMARCVEPSKYFDLIEVIFKNQERWTKADDQVKSLMQLGSLAGMDETTMIACMNNDELESAIAASVNEAQSKFEIKATPTFVVNYGVESFTGAQDVSKFEEVVNRLSAGK